MDVDDRTLRAVTPVDPVVSSWDTVWRVLDTWQRPYDRGVWRALLDHADPLEVAGLVREWVKLASPEDARFVPKPSVVASMWAERHSPLPALSGRSYAGFKCWGCGRPHDPSVGNGLAHCPGCQSRREERWV